MYFFIRSVAVWLWFSLSLSPSLYPSLPPFLSLSLCLPPSNPLSLWLTQGSKKCHGGDIKHLLDMNWLTSDKEKSQKRIPKNFHFLGRKNDKIFWNCFGSNLKGRDRCSKNGWTTSGKRATKWYQISLKAKPIRYMIKLLTKWHHFNEWVIVPWNYLIAKLEVNISSILT